MQPTSQFRSVCLTEQRHRESRGRGRLQPGYSSALGGAGFGWRAGCSPTTDPLRDGRNSETDESTNRQDFTGGYMNEIIAARWIILTDRFLACVCVGVCGCVCVCIEGDARQGLPFSTQYVFAGLLLFFVCLFRYGNLFSLDTTCVCGSLVRLV